MQGMAEAARKLERQNLISDFDLGLTQEIRWVNGVDFNVTDTESAQKVIDEVKNRQQKHLDKLTVISQSFPDLQLDLADKILQMRSEIIIALLRRIVDEGDLVTWTGKFKTAAKKSFELVVRQLIMDQSFLPPSARGEIPALVAWMRSKLKGEADERPTGLQAKKVIFETKAATEQSSRIPAEIIQTTARFESVISSLSQRINPTFDASQPYENAPNAFVFLLTEQQQAQAGMQQWLDYARKNSARDLDEATLLANYDRLVDEAEKLRPRLLDAHPAIQRLDVQLNTLRSDENAHSLVLDGSQDVSARISALATEATQARALVAFDNRLHTLIENRLGNIESRLQTAQDNYLEIQAHQPIVQAFENFLNTISDAAGTLTGGYGADAAAIRLTLDNSVAQFTALEQRLRDRTANELLNQLKEALINRATNVNRQLEQRWHAAQVTEYPTNLNYRNLVTRITPIEGVDLVNGIAPHNPAGLDTAALTQMQTRLQSQLTIARAASPNVLEFATFSAPSNNALKALVEAFATRVNDAEQKIEQAIDRSKQPEKKADLLAKMNKVWGRILIPEFAQTQEESLKGEADELRELAEEYGFNAQETALLERCFKMRDAAYRYTGLSAMRHLTWQKVDEARQKATALSEAKGLREDFAQVENFLGFDVKEAVEYIDNTVFEVDWVIDKTTKQQKIWDYSSGMPDPSRYLVWNYAAMGNPDPEFISAGVKDIRGLLLEKFPDLGTTIPEFVLDSLSFFIIVSEMRMEKFYKHYQDYRASPIKGVDANSVMPWGVPGFLAYKAAAIAGVPKYRTILMSTRFPSSIPGEPSFSIQDTKHANDPGFQYPEYMADRPYYAGGRPDDKRKANATANIQMLVKIRNTMIKEFSPIVTDYDHVELHPDLKILPSPYDVVKGEWRGQKLEMTLDDLFEVYTQMDVFFGEIDNPKTIKNHTDAATAIVDLINNISKFKMILGKLTDPVFADMSKLVNIMVLTYVRKVATQYYKLDKERGIGNTFLTKRELFLEMAIKEFKDSATLPGGIKKYIVPILESANVGKFATIGNKWALFFKDDQPPFTEMDLQAWAGTKYFKEFQSWLKPPELKDKDAN